MAKRSWSIYPSIPTDKAEALKGIPLSTAQISFNRGLSNLSQIKSFLSVSKETLGDPNLLPDIDTAIGRLEQAIKSDELIGIYGDFDADGITATALLYEGLSDLGARTTPYIPHRTEEGHGLSEKGVESLKDLGTSLILTADCGVSSFDEVASATKNGLDVIITDHHTPPDRLPDALAIVDPKRKDSKYPFQDLAAVGLTYRLLQLLRNTMGKGDDERYLDLVALGSVADMAPLIGENRYLVKQGLEFLNKTERPGLRELARLAGLSPGEIDAESIAFGLAPKINAAGRVDHAITSYRLLTATSTKEARPLAEEIDDRNRQRRVQTQAVVERAKEQVKNSFTDFDILIVGGMGYETGVLGLAASKLVEDYYKPAIVYSKGPEVTRASARSIPEFDIIAALQECSDLFIRFGGHSQAAGFIINNQNLELLSERLRSIAKKQIGELNLLPAINIDVELPLNEIEGRLIKFVRLLEPVGQGNPCPIFLSRGVEVLDSKHLGIDGSHMRLKLRDNANVWNAVAFHLGNRLNELTQVIDVVYQLKINKWQGSEKLELSLLDFMPTQH